MSGLVLFQALRGKLCDSMIRVSGYILKNGSDSYAQVGVKGATSLCPKMGPSHIFADVGWVENFRWREYVSYVAHYMDNLDCVAFHDIFF